MTEVLSQDEIDQLLAAINTGDIEPEDFQPRSNVRKIRIYDFKRPDAFSKDQIRTISMIHEFFARLMTSTISAHCRTIVHFHLASVDQLTYEEFIRSIPTPTTLAIINMDPLKGNAILEIDPAVTFSIIDRVLGGTGECIECQHELTDVEASLMKNIIARQLGNLRDAWTQIIDLRPRLGQIDTNPQFAQIVHPNEMTVLVTIEAKIGDIEGMVNLCIPYSTIAPVTDKLTSVFWYGKKIATTKNYHLLSGHDIPVRLVAEILKREYTIKEVSGWKEETILLPLCQLQLDSCYLKIGDRRVWQCKIMKDEHWFPKKIEITKYADDPFKTEGKIEMSKINPNVADALSMAGITISVELGATSKPIRDILAMGEGTIVELDKLAGEPVDVKANGVLIAKGEVVVVDENFGVRITEIVGTLGPLEKSADQ